MKLKFILLTSCVVGLYASQPPKGPIKLNPVLVSVLQAVGTDQKSQTNQTQKGPLARVRKLIESERSAAVRDVGERPGSGKGITAVKGQMQMPKKVPEDKAWYNAPVKEPKKTRQ